MLVRLSVPWTDPFGIGHSAGELVDIDPVTLAELEEQGVVEDMAETPDVQNSFIGPGAPPKDDPDHFIGPGSPPPDDEPIESDFIGPGSPPQDDEINN